MAKGEIRKRQEKTVKFRIDKQDELILSKLDTINGLLAAQGKEPNQPIKILRSLGFTIKQISDVTGLADGTIKTKMRSKRLARK